MQLTQKPWAVGLISAALLGGFGVSAETQPVTETQPETVTVTDATTTTDLQTSPRRSFVTDLAKASLAGGDEPTEGQLADAESSIQADRDSGMGWGQIANALGLNLGAVVSAVNRAQPAAASHAANANKPTESGLKSQNAAASGRSDTGAGNGGGGNGGGGRGK